LDNKPAPRFIAFGQVVGIHIDERYIKDGLLDTAAMKPISRAGYQEYFVATSDTRFFVKFTEENGMRAQPPSKSAHE
jgi:flavin reductase (DIM6/NTAB) family NADH-FMN oxidoreductase RutF